MAEVLELTSEWDKVFPKSEKVNHRKVTFHNRYGITLAADLYEPKDAAEKLPALAVSGPFGAVKEQSSGLYAQTMAERGYLTIAFDPSFTGESGGTPRYMASPDINTEDFQAAVDFLSVQDNVDPERIGIIGICGWGGMALNTAAIDTRIKATVAATMYDMSRVNAKGYFDSEDSEEARYQKRAAMNAQRTADYRSGSYQRAGGVVDPLPEDAPFFVKDYYDYYKTKRGYHKRSLNSNEGWNTIGCMSFLNHPILQYSDEIRSAVLLIHGDKAHSCYFSKDAFQKLKGDNKELMLIPGAVHTDLYDRMDVIPFDKIDAFFQKYLKETNIWLYPLELPILSQTRCITKTGKTRELSWHCRFLTAVILLFQVFHFSKASPAFLTGTQTSYCVSEGLGSKYTSTSESSMSAEEETAIKYLHCSLSLQALTPRTPCGFPFISEIIFASVPSSTAFCGVCIPKEKSRLYKRTFSENGTLNNRRSWQALDNQSLP